MKLDIVVGALLPVCINPQYNLIRELKHHSVERQGSVSSHHRSSPVASSDDEVTEVEEVAGLR
jgi:hypothetical protein